jgi:outer membrane protein assembly factor BamD
MQNIIKLTVTLSLLTLSLSGCFLSNETKRESITKGWSPKTFFQQAKNSDSTEESIELFEQLQAAYPGSKYALQSKLEIAYRLYKNEDYNAGPAFSNRLSFCLVAQKATTQ